MQHHAYYVMYVLYILDMCYIYIYLYCISSLEDFYRAKIKNRNQKAYTQIFYYYLSVRELG